MVNRYKTTFPNEMSDSQRNFVIEMLKGMIPRKHPIDVSEEIEHAVSSQNLNLGPAVSAG